MTVEKAVNVAVEILKAVGYEDIYSMGGDDDGSTSWSYYYGRFEGQLFEIKVEHEEDAEDVVIYDRKSEREDWSYVGREDL